MSTGDGIGTGDCTRGNGTETQPVSDRHSIQPEAPGQNLGAI